MRMSDKWLTNTWLNMSEFRKSEEYKIEKCTLFICFCFFVIIHEDGPRHTEIPCTMLLLKSTTEQRLCTGN